MAKQLNWLQVDKTIRQNGLTLVSPQDLRHLLKGSEASLRFLLTRGKPRDFFDLYFLLRKGLITPPMKPKLKTVQDRLEGLNMDFHAELAQFLPRSTLGIMRDFRATLREELSRHGV